MARLLDSSSRTTALLDRASRAIDETYVLIGEARQLRAQLRWRRQELDAIERPARPRLRIVAAPKPAPLRGWLPGVLLPVRTFQGETKG